MIGEKPSFLRDVSVQVSTYMYKEESRGPLLSFKFLKADEDVLTAVGSVQLLKNLIVVTKKDLFAAGLTAFGCRLGADDLSKVVPRH